MPLTVIKASDPITVDTLILMLVGEPGIGKTSIAFTASAPLLLDFDHGAHRSGNRKDSVKVTNWEQVSRLTAEDFADYDTIVIDTAGRCLDVITAHLAESNPKLVRGSGALSMQGFGELKSTFIAWMKRLRALGLDIILLAHDAEEKDGDSVRARPDITGGSRGELIKVADLLGYMHMDGNYRVLDFSPTDRWLGKNCAGFDTLRIPSFKVDPDFLARVIAKAKASLNAQAVAASAEQVVLDHWREVIDNSVVNLIEANAALQHIQKANLGTQAKTVKGMLLTKAKAIGLEFDRASGVFKIKEAVAA